MDKKSYGKREAPFSLRLTCEERTWLERQSAGMPMGAFIKSRLFGAGHKPRHRRGKAPVKDHKALAELLACMGASRLSNNLNQLAKSANSGTLYFDFETKRDITRASDDIRNMRLLLMRALGMRLNDQHKRDESTSQSFARASLDERRYRL
jgi:hypothetical protein